MFELFYQHEKLGDDSVGTYFHQTKEGAEQADAEQEESFPESAVDSIVLRIHEGKIQFREGCSDIAERDADGYVWRDVRPKA